MSSLSLVFGGCPLVSWKHVFEKRCLSYRPISDNLDLRPGVSAPAAGEHNECATKGTKVRKVARESLSFGHDLSARHVHVPR